MYADDVAGSPIRAEAPPSRPASASCLLRPAELRALTSTATLERPTMDHVRTTAPGVPTLVLSRE